MECKKRRSDVTTNVPLELALFGLDQIPDIGIIFLHQSGENFEIAFGNTCFWNLFGVSTQSDFVVEKFIAQNDVALFKDQLSKSTSESVRLQIRTTAKLDSREHTFHKSARVSCSRFGEEFFCCKFQLCDPSLEETLKWYQIADEKLCIPWGVYRYEADKRDIYTLFENPLSRYRRQPLSINTSFYCRTDGALRNEAEFEWWLEKASKINEDHPKECIVRDSTIYGTLKSIKSSFHFIGRDAGGYPMFIGLHEDITQTNELKKTLCDKEKTLTELDLTNKCLRHFFDIAPLHMGVIRLVHNNTDIVYLSANDYHEKVLRRSLVGVHGKEVASEENVAVWIQKYLEAKETKQVVQFPYAQSVMGKSAHLYCYAVHVDGDMFAFLSQDVTENYLLDQELKKNQAELEEKIKLRTKELEEALQVKSRFLATMSHEMRTPLSASSGAMSLLELNPLSDEQKNLIRIAHVCDEQLLSVINDVLDWSKLEENKVVLKEEPFDIRNTLEESLVMISFDAPSKGLELVSAIDPSVPQTIVGDSGRIRQIMVNLLSNAVKFSLEGEIVLRATACIQEDNTCEIIMSVQDQGIGIQEEDKSKLFQVFTQLDNSATRRHGGTGLGLAISKKFAELMGGKMWFESTLGKGSTFYASIKAHIVPTEPHNRQKELFTCGVIDKSQTCSNHLCLLLENLGYSAKVLSSLEEAQSVDILFLDSRTPLESFLQTSSNKALVFTAYPTQQTCVPNGYHTLLKPVREICLFQLLEVINKRSVATNNSTSTVEEIGSNWKNLKVLLAEDNDMNQQVVTKMLRTLSLQDVTIASNGKLAVEKAREHPYDLILMDMMMPEMGGLEATEIIRKELGDTPVIVALTANVFPDDQERCVQAGMQEVLTKPVSRKEFARVLRKYFGS